MIVPIMTEEQTESAVELDIEPNAVRAELARRQARSLLFTRPGF